MITTLVYISAFLKERGAVDDDNSSSSDPCANWPDVGVGSLPQLCILSTMRIPLSAYVSLIIRFLYGGFNREYKEMRRPFPTSRG